MDRQSHEGTVAGRVKAGDSQWGAVCVSGAGESRRANRPSDSNPASVEESAAAEQQHHEEDDEQCGRVHVFLPLCWRARPCGLAVNARDDDGDSAPGRSGSPQSDLQTTSGAGWRLFPSEQQEREADEKNRDQQKRGRAQT